MRRIAATIAIVAAGLLGSTAAASAAPARTLVGPECNPSVSTAVLASLTANHIVLPPGSTVQYLQFVTIGGVFTVQPCVVTIH